MKLPVPSAFLGHGRPLLRLTRHPSVAQEIEYQRCLEGDKLRVPILPCPYHMPSLFTISRYESQIDALWSCVCGRFTCKASPHLPDEEFCRHRSGSSQRARSGVKPDKTATTHWKVLYSRTLLGRFAAGAS